jgi:cytidylate kinase
MEALAAEGNVVIVGRAGQVILRDRPDVLHVRSSRLPECGPSGSPGSRDRARSRAGQIEASDRHRRIYLKRFDHVRWDDPSLYDLIVNTARVTPEAAAELIGAALPLRLRASGRDRVQAQEPILELD